MFEINHMCYQYVFFFVFFFYLFIQPALKALSICEIQLFLLPLKVALLAVCKVTNIINSHLVSICPFWRFNKNLPQVPDAVACKTVQHKPHSRQRRTHDRVILMNLLTYDGQIWMCESCFTFPLLSERWGAAEVGGGGTERNPPPHYGTQRQNEPSCCCTWREKGRQATVGRRSLKSRGHAFNPNVSAGRALCPLPLLLPSLPLRDPCVLTASSSYLMKDVEDRAGANFQDCVRASGTIWPPLPKTQGGVLFRDFFPESRPVTWKHLGCPPPPRPALSPALLIQRAD